MWTYQIRQYPYAPNGLHTCVEMYKDDKKVDEFSARQVFDKDFVKFLALARYDSPDHLQAFKVAADELQIEYGIH